jgi:hypothetical protein
MIRSSGSERLQQCEIKLNPGILLRNHSLYRYQCGINMTRAMAAKRTPKRGSPLSRAKLACKKSARSKSVHQTVSANRLKKIWGAIELLRHCRPTLEWRFVIVQYLNPHDGSRLPRLLGKVTAMPLIELTETKSVAR